MQYKVLMPESELKQDLPRKSVHLSKHQTSDPQKRKKSSKLAFHDYSLRQWKRS